MTACKADSELLTVCVLLIDLYPNHQQKGNNSSFFEMSTVEQSQHTRRPLLTSEPPPVIVDFPMAIIAETRCAEMRAERFLIDAVGIVEGGHDDALPVPESVAAVRLNSSIDRCQSLRGNDDIWIILYRFLCH